VRLPHPALKEKHGLISLQPVNLQTARFFGANNILPGAVRGGIIETELGRFQAGSNHLPPGPVTLAIRPESILIVQQRESDMNTISGRVRSCNFTGTRTRLKIATEIALVEVITEVSAMGRYQEGDTVLLFLPPEKLWAYPDPQTGPAI